MERFNLKKLNEAEGKEQYRVEVSNRFVALEDLDAEVEINSVWEMIRENIISAKESLGYCELKKYKPWFDQACSKLVDQRKHAKLQWLQDPSKTNGDNLKIVRHEASRYFRNNKMEYMKDKINELATNTNNNQLRNNLVKDENGDMLADFHNILNRWKKYSQLLNVHKVRDVRQIEVHTAEPLVPDPSPLKLKLLLQS
jgi:hypothetical protein